MWKWRVDFVLKWKWRGKERRVRGESIQKSGVCRFITRFYRFARMLENLLGITRYHAILILADTTVETSLNDYGIHIRN